MIATMAGFLGGLSTPNSPTMTHTASGQFTINSYNSSLVYTPTLVSGSGTASLNTGTGVFTLSSTTARFMVTAGWSAGATQSGNGFMERTPYTYTSVNQPYACGTHQCNCSTSWGSCGCGGCGGYPSPNGQSWGQCGCPGDMCWYNPGTTCQTCTSYCDNFVNVKNGTPSGYVDQHGEWSRVT